MTKIGLQFGALAPPLEDQLTKQGVAVDDIITEAETHRARKRLMKWISAHGHRRPTMVSEDTWVLSWIVAPLFAACVLMLLCTIEGVRETNARDDARARSKREADDGE